MTQTRVIEAMIEASNCTSQKEAALVFTRHGIAVFPCRADKSPLTKRGFKDATTDIQAIRDAWDAHPNALIGAPTGKSAGFVVIDLDVGKDKDGPGELSRMVQGDEWFGSVPTVLTPSGGQHLFFGAPVEPVKSVANRLAPGVDTRGEGGYIILPPSQTANGAYRLVSQPPIGGLPPVLVEALNDAGIMGSHTAPRTVAPVARADAAGVAMDIQAALVFIDPDSGYSDWVSVGMALYHHDPVRGLALWIEWSSRGSKFQPGECERKWDSFGNVPAGTAQITERTIFWMARAQGWNPMHPQDTDDPLAQQHGIPIVCRSESRCAPNHGYIAAYYLRKTGAVYEAASGLFWAYDDATGLWKAVSRLTHSRELSDVYRDVLVENGAADLLATRTSRTLGDISAMAQGLAFVPDPFRSDEGLIHCANGMLRLPDVGEPELLPFSPEWFSRNRTEIEWAPDSDCPEFLAAIGQFLTPDDCLALQTFFGQCLLGTNLTQRILIIRGPAGLMKSTLQRILLLLVGIENAETLRPAHLGGRFELARYVGRTLLVAADVDSGFLAGSSAHILKSLVGGDSMSVERKGSNESATIHGTFNVCVTSNVDLRLHLEGDRDAWGRRLILLDCQGTKPARTIPDFADYIMEREGPGILRWAVEGAMRLKACVRDKRGFPISSAMQSRVDDLLDRSDSVQTFVARHVVVDADSDLSVAELFEAYDCFCAAKGWEPLSEREFQCQLSPAMRSCHGAAKTHGLMRDDRNVRGFHGVALCASEDAEKLMV